MDFCYSWGHGTSLVIYKVHMLSTNVFSALITLFLCHLPIQFRCLLAFYKWWSRISVIFDMLQAFYLYISLLICDSSMYLDGYVRWSGLNRKPNRYRILCTWYWIVDIVMFLCMTLIVGSLSANSVGLGI